MNNIVIFETENQPVQVRLEGETVWLVQAQMAELFSTSADNISLHLKSIFKDKELEDAETTDDFSVVRQEGARQHLVEGYTLNQQRLRERGIEFEQALDLLSRTLANQQLVSTEGEAVLRVIADYARSWSLLPDYDEQSLVSHHDSESR